MLHTKEEIRNFILSTLHNETFKGVCRVSYINKQCFDESLLITLLSEMEAAKEIKVEMPFIKLIK